MTIEKKITDYTELTALASGDVLYVVRPSQGAGGDHKVTLDNLFHNVPIPCTINVASGFTGTAFGVAINGANLLSLNEHGCLLVAAQSGYGGNPLQVNFSGSTVASISTAGYLTLVGGITASGSFTFTGALGVTNANVGGNLTVSNLATINSLSVTVGGASIVGNSSITGTLGVSDNVTLATGKHLSSEILWMGTSVYAALGSLPLSIAWDGSSSNPSIKSSGGFSTTYDLSVGRNLTVVGTSTLGGDTTVTGVLKSIGISGSHAKITATNTMSTDQATYAEFVEISYPSDAISFGIRSFAKPPMDGAMMIVSMTFPTSMSTGTLVTYYNATGFAGTQAPIQWWANKTGTGSSIVLSLASSTIPKTIHLRYSTADTAWILLG